MKRLLSGKDFWPTRSYRIGPTGAALFSTFNYPRDILKFSVINTTFDVLGPMPEESILKIFSGYVLIPKNNVDVSNRLYCAPKTGPAKAIS
jgi:hypothetical protein